MSRLAPKVFFDIMYDLFNIDTFYLMHIGYLNKTKTNYSLHQIILRNKNLLSTYYVNIISVFLF